MQTSPSTSQALVNSTEQFASILSETLNDDTTEVTKAKPNIGKVSKSFGNFVVLYLYTVIKAEHISSDSVDKDYVFPDEDDNLSDYNGGNTQLMVPIGLLQNISKNIL